MDVTEKSNFREIIRDKRLQEKILKRSTAKLEHAHCVQNIEKLNVVNQV